MNRQSAGAQLRLGMPLAAVRDAVAQVGEGGEERLYLEVPLALLQAAMPEVAGHVAGMGDDGSIVLELDDEDFNVSGAGRF